MLHPLLPCGYNSTENNGDELNGAGVNEAVWPDLFNSFVGLAPIIMEDELLAAFNTCPDYVVGSENRLLVIPPERDTMVIR